MVPNKQENKTLVTKQFLGQGITKKGRVSINKGKIQLPPKKA